MANPLLRTLYQRRRAGTLTVEAPTRPELEAAVLAALGQPSARRHTPWRLVATARTKAPELAAALCGLRSLPDIGDGSAPLKGKQLRRLAAFRGALNLVMKGGLAVAVVFSPEDGWEAPRRIQRLEAITVRPLMEAALCATGWGVQWEAHEQDATPQLREFYGLGDHEEVLGWLFVGRPDRPDEPPATAAADEADRVARHVELLR